MVFFRLADGGTVYEVYRLLDHKMHHFLLDMSTCQKGLWARCVKEQLSVEKQIQQTKYCWKMEILESF